MTDRFLPNGSSTNKYTSHSSEPESSAGTGSGAVRASSEPETSVPPAAKAVRFSQHLRLREEGNDGESVVRMARLLLRSENAPSD